MLPKAPWVPRLPPFPHRVGYCCRWPSHRDADPYHPATRKWLSTNAAAFTRSPSFLKVSALAMSIISGVNMKSGRRSALKLILVLLPVGLVIGMAIQFGSNQMGWQRPKGFDVVVMNESDTEIGPLGFYVGGESDKKITEIMPAGDEELARIYYALDTEVVLAMEDASGRRYLLFSGRREERLVPVKVQLAGVDALGVLRGTVTVGSRLATPLDEVTVPDAGS